MKRNHAITTLLRVNDTLFIIDFERFITCNCRFTTRQVNLRKLYL